MATDTDHDRRRGALTAPEAVGPLRVAIGFAQGIAAWCLLRLVQPNADRFSHGVHRLYWSEQHAVLFASLALLIAYLPVIAIAEVARMRRRTLLVYLLLSGAFLATLTAYDLWRDPFELFGASQVVRVWPSFGLCLGTAIGLFIVNQLLEHHERGYALFANYAEHFEDSWMRGFQLVVSLIFSLLVWGVLNLGAALFDLIHIKALQTTIDHDWFRCSALAMAFAAAIHITDVRPALIKGMRNVTLTLLSWLLPLVVVLAIGFLCALLFVGLKPLWATRRAAGILLTAGALMIFLLNATYKDGDGAALPPAVLRWAGRAAGPTALILTLLACYGIVLRVLQYGWTPQRVVSGAVAIMALLYGAGYTRAALSRTSWLKPLERVNVGASLAMIAILVLLLTPAANPVGLSVNSQLSRLLQGRVAPAKFDYSFLRFDAGTYGQRALARLTHAQSADIRDRAARMQSRKSRQFLALEGQGGELTEAALSHATIYPRGVQLPEDFIKSDLMSDTGSAADCLQNGGSCDIYVIRYGTAQDTAVLVRPLNASAMPGRPFAGSGTVGRLYQRDAKGQWVNSGSFDHLGCPGVVGALRTGNLAAVRPQHDDLLVNGVRLEYSSVRTGAEPCVVPAGPPITSLPAHAREATAPGQMGPAFGSSGIP